jgi:hypothetical protein
MHLLTVLKDQASDVLHRNPKAAMYKETIRANEDWFGDQYLLLGYPNQLKTWTQDNGEPMQEFGTAIEQLTSFAFPTLHEDHVCRRPGKAFGNDIRDQGIKEADTPGRQEDTQWDLQADPKAGSLNTSSLSFLSGSRKWVTGHCGRARPISSLVFC